MESALYDEVGVEFRLAVFWSPWSHAVTEAVGKENPASSMTREEKSRREIDHQFARCGWWVQTRDEINISASLGVAARGFSRVTGKAGYLHLCKVRRSAG